MYSRTSMSIVSTPVLNAGLYPNFELCLPPTPRPRPYVAPVDDTPNDRPGGSRTGVDLEPIHNTSSHEYRRRRCYHIVAPWPSDGTPLSDSTTYNVRSRRRSLLFTGTQSTLGLPEFRGRRVHALRRVRSSHLAFVDMRQHFGLKLPVPRLAYPICFR